MNKINATVMVEGSVPASVPHKYRGTGTGWVKMPDGKMSRKCFYCGEGRHK